jgi:hypothetical protein
MTRFPLKLKASRGTLENWMMFEEGSYEDAGCPDANGKRHDGVIVPVHLHMIAQRHTTVLELKDREEAVRAARSLEYFGDSLGWDPPQYATRAAMRRLARKIRRALDA